MKTILTQVDAATHSERIAELGQALAKEYDLADDLAKAIRWYLRDQNIPSRQAVDEALGVWEEARRG